MTTWDHIYKNYQKGGEAWATLGEDIIPQFLTLIENNVFTTCSALDIGCGTGKYLEYLNQKGFRVSGIDSSETAVQMTKEKLIDADIKCVNMFEYDIPHQAYDFIFSISTIHHGMKSQVQTLINKIYSALLPGGKLLITLPDYESSKKWNTFKDHTELAPATYAPLSGPEKGLAHSFYTKEEIPLIFSDFHNLNMELDTIGRWIITASKDA